jgi:hypothetical protein
LHSSGRAYFGAILIAPSSRIVSLDLQDAADPHVDREELIELDLLSDRHRRSVQSDDRRR